MDIPPLFLDDVKDCPGDYIGCEICRFQDQCFEMKMGLLNQRLETLSSKNDTNLN